MEFPVIERSKHKGYPYVVTFKNRNCYGFLCRTLEDAIVEWFRRLKYIKW
jgi:hypothetical protein